MNAYSYEDPGPRRVAIISTLLLHVAVVAVILSHPPARSAIAKAMPMMVSLITAERARLPEAPPRPMPMRQNFEMAQPVVPLPNITIATPSQAAAKASSVPAQSENARPATIVLSVVSPRFDAAYLQNPAPAYPPLARRMGERGRVLLRVLVTAEGTADRVELNTSSGSSRLDIAALETVQRWHFVPARQGERAVAAWVLVPISFSLES
jgi:protein TonB